VPTAVKYWAPMSSHCLISGSSSAHILQCLLVCGAASKLEAGRANRKNGNADAVWVSATNNGPALMDSINQAAPTLCINVPTSEKMSAISKSRNVCPRRGRHTLDVVLVRSFPVDGCKGVDSIGRNPCAVFKLLSDM